MEMEPDLQRGEGWEGDREDETATGVSKYVQISQGGKFAATGIPWSLGMALQQAVKVEGEERVRSSRC